MTGLVKINPFYNWHRLSFYFEKVSGGVDGWKFTVKGSPDDLSPNLTDANEWLETTRARVNSEIGSSII